jgi:molybdopterin-guanine dinucleotide biosynthesis protein A
MVDAAVILLAGGAATRFPNKLERTIDGRPVLAHSYDRVAAAGFPVYIAGKGSFSPQLDRYLNAPLIVDRRNGRGPLAAFLNACVLVQARRLFAVAADLPYLDAGVMQRLSTAWQTGDEAVVPIHDRGTEPLCALYDRNAVLRTGFELHTAGRTAMRDLIRRLSARFERCDERFFHNVNRPEDLP